MKLDVKAISAGEGAEAPFDYSLDLSGLAKDGMRPFPDPVRVYGAIQHRSGIFYIRGFIDAEAKLQCARCLADIVRQKHVEISGTLSEHAESAEEDDVFPLEGTVADLDAIAVTALFLSMDMVDLCRPGCKGLCPLCGKDLNDGPCGCGEKRADPRLSPLAALLEKKD